MWNYQSKVNYLCVKLRVHFRVFRKKMQAVVLAVFRAVEHPKAVNKLLIKVTGTHFQYDEFNYDASIYGNISAGKMYK